MRFIAGIATILVVPIVAVATVMSLLVVRGVTAPLSGAVFTTTADGEIVNENVHYDSKIDVYLDGGPGPHAPKTAAGLPDGSYYFQVTDPSGVVLLSEDPAKCREIRVQGGVIVQLVSIGRTYGPHNTPCSIQDLPTPPYDPSIFDGIPGAGGRHDANVDLDHGPPAIVVQLMPFFNTPNGGGVYKVWVIPTSAYRENGGDANAVPAALEEKGSRIGYARDPGFGPPRDQVKTDNFKISAEAVESPTATLTPVPTRTKTPSQTATTTSVPATPTSTCTSIPPTSTSTAAPPTATPTNTPIPPTLTPTDTVAPPTATSTNTPMPPTATQTPSPSPTVTPTASSTPVPPTPTFTSAPPTATRTATVTVATKTPLATHTRRPRHSATPVSRTATSVPAQPTATRTPFSQVATAAVTPVRTPTPRPTGLPIAGSGRADGILWAAIGSVCVLLLIGGGLVAGVRYSHQKPK